mmetsp:Transcript_17537/g.32501  ORF Transcript_17537/g.32501 Transcript_17537/m.32501 type:complete len:246 (+) Transcript_17537:3684-4421(+)
MSSAGTHNCWWAGRCRHRRAPGGQGVGVAAGARDAEPGNLDVQILLLPAEISASDGVGILVHIVEVGRLCRWKSLTIWRDVDFPTKDRCPAIGATEIPCNDQLCVRGACHIDRIWCCWWRCRNDRGRNLRFEATADHGAKLELRPIRMARDNARCERVLQHCCVVYRSLLIGIIIITSIVHKDAPSSVNGVVERHSVGCRQRHRQCCSSGAQHWWERNPRPRRTKHTHGRRQRTLSSGATHSVHS